MTTTQIQPDTESIIDLESMIQEYEETDDANTKAHIVRPTENEHLGLGVYATGKDIVDTARVLGLEIVALCGYKFVPRFNPDNHDACSICMDIAGKLFREAQD